MTKKNNNPTKWDKIIEKFQKRKRLFEAGYSGQGHTSGAESFYGGYFGYGGDKQLAAKPIAIVRKIKKQEDEELTKNFKDQQEKNRGYPAAVSGFAGGDGGGGGNSGLRIPNNIPQIGKSAKELDDEFSGNPAKNYWGSIPDEKDTNRETPEEKDEDKNDISEQAVGGAGGGPVRGGASDSAYRDLPGFPRMNSLDDKRVFVPPVEGDYDGDGEEDEYLEHEEYVNDVLRLNGLNVKPEKKEKLFYPDGIREKRMFPKLKTMFFERTLYHGTVIDNLESIKDLGLSGQLGDFVEESYGLELDPEDYEEELSGITFAADKNTLDSAVGAMRFNIGKKLDKWLGDVTEDDIRKYGMLVVIKDIDEPDGDDGDKDYDTDSDFGSSWHQRPKNQESEGYYANFPMSVEPGDWFIKDGTHYDFILTGKKMLKFLRQYGGLGDVTTDKRRQLIKLAIKHYGAARSREEIIKKVNQLNKSEISIMLYNYKKLGKDNKTKPLALEGIKRLKNIFFEGGDYGSPGGSLGSGGTEKYKQGYKNQEPFANLLMKPIDYSGGHETVPAADHSNGGVGYGNTVAPKDFVPEDWEQRNWKSKELPPQEEDLERMELGEDKKETSLDERAAISSKKLIRKLNKNKKPGCEKIRQKGSHVSYKCGSCSTVVPSHGSKDIKVGTLHSIEKDLESCLGDGWLEEEVEKFIEEMKIGEDYTGIDDNTGKGKPKGGSRAYKINKKKVLNLDAKQKPKGIEDLNNYHMKNENKNE